MPYITVTLNRCSCTQIIFTLYMQDGISPLYGASQEGHTDVVDLLVRAGADIHQATKVLPW